MPAGRLAAGAGTGYVNLVAGPEHWPPSSKPPAGRAGRGGPPSKALGGKADSDAVRKAVEEGFRWAS